MNLGFDPAIGAIFIALPPLMLLEAVWVGVFFHWHRRLPKGRDWFIGQDIFRHDPRP